MLPPAPVLLPLLALQVLFDEIEPEHPEFDRVRKPTEQRRFVSAFELIKAGDDAVGLPTRLDVIDQAVQTQPTPRQRSDVFREESAEEQRIVTDVLAYFALRSNDRASSIGLDSTSISPTSSSRFPQELRIWYR